MPRKTKRVEQPAPAPEPVPVVIRLVSLVNGQPHPLDGKYVVRFHPGPPSMPLGQCLLVTTHDVSKAHVYPDHAAAHAEWTRIDPRQPLRADGKPNRPLTAWTCAFVPAPPAVATGVGQTAT